MEKRNTAILNVSAGVIQQGLSIVAGFILPRLILSSFGSEINGLISSLQQFLNYIGLFDGGVSIVIMTALYKPLSENDSERISAIIVAADSFFKKIGRAYVVYAGMLSMIYPIFVHTKFSWAYVASLSVILGITLFIQYMFSITYRTLLIADKMGYVVYFSQSVFCVINLLISVAVIKIYPEVHLLKLLSAAAFAIQPLLYSHFVKKYYSIDKSVTADPTALKQRWDGFGQNFALFIHNNTDVVILTFLSSLQLVSVYTVYVMVINSIKTVITTISQAIFPTVGHIYVSGDNDRTNEAFDAYELIMFSITSLLYGCVIVLLVPFVQIYTTGIDDADYYQPLFGVILSFAYALECYQEPNLQLSYIANKFKETAKYSYVEVIINIVISIILVWKWGVIGVAIGTTSSVLYRIVCLAIYNKNNILKRSFKKWLFGMLNSAIVVFLIYYISTHIISWDGICIALWIKNAFISFVLASIIILADIILLYRDRLKILLSMF